MLKSTYPSFVIPTEIASLNHAMHYESFFEQGSVGFAAPERITDAEMAVLKRFADVFGFAYDRFLELQEKEERNRELEVENALERVRAKALGMQRSDELSEVSETLFDQFDGLGFSIFRLSVRYLRQSRRLEMRVNRSKRLKTICHLKVAST